jgi:hypothetical protein
MRILKLFAVSAFGSAVPLAAYFWWILTAISFLFGSDWNPSRVWILIGYTSIMAVCFGAVFALVHWSKVPTIVTSLAAGVVYFAGLLGWAFMVNNWTFVHIQGDIPSMIGLSLSAAAFAFISVKMFGAGRID